MSRYLHTDESLLQMILDKSRPGAEAVYDRYARVLHLAIFRIVQQRELADDLLEKTFCKIWNDIDQYNKLQAPLLAWMLAIAKNTARAAANNYGS